MISHTEINIFKLLKNNIKYANKFKPCPPISFLSVRCFLFTTHCGNTIVVNPNQMMKLVAMVNPGTGRSNTDRPLALLASALDVVLVALAAFGVIGFAAADAVEMIVECGWLSFTSTANG
jgi:hypothetical protein